VAPPVATRQRRAVPSPIPPAKVCPSGLNATDHTGLARPANSALPVPVATFHSHAAPSLPPDASHMPFRLKVTDRTAPR